MLVFMLAAIFTTSDVFGFRWAHHQENRANNEGLMTVTYFGEAVGFCRAVALAKVREIEDYLKKNDCESRKRILSSKNFSHSH